MTKENPLLQDLSNKPQERVVPRAFSDPDFARDLAKRAAIVTTRTRVQEGMTSEEMIPSSEALQLIHNH